MGKMTLPDASAMPFEKEQSVLATQRDYAAKATKKMSYLKAEDKYDPESFLREPEMTELYSFNKHAFCWKSGKYTVSIEMQSPENFDVVDNVREFYFTPLDIENMEKNKDLLGLDYKNIILGSEEKFDWQWCNPNLVKT